MWRSGFKKYWAGGITWAALLGLPINDSSVSILIFVEANTLLMLFVQDVCSSFGRNTLKKWLFMYHPRHVFRLASFPSPPIFLRESELFHSSVLDACSGRNSVWMTNKAALFARSIQYLSSSVMLMMLLMNPSINASLTSMFTARGSDFQDNTMIRVYPPLVVGSCVVS